MTTSGIQRTSPPQAVQKIRDGVFMVQVGISGSPSADWRRLFYDGQQEVTADFPPRSVEISGNFLRFKSDPSTVEQKIRVLDLWMERASRKVAAMGGRTEGQREKKEELEREALEIAEWNSRWAKL